MISLGTDFLALFEAPGVISGFENVAVVSDAVEERGGHLWVAEDRDPFGEAEIGCDDEGCLFVELADEMERCCQTNANQSPIPLPRLGFRPPKVRATRRERRRGL